MKTRLFVLLSIIPLVACSNSGTQSIVSSDSTKLVSSEDNTSSVIAPEITNLKAVSQGHFTEPQLNYLNNDDASNTSPYNGNMSVSKPLPVHISWESNVSGPFEVKISPKNHSSYVSYIVEETSFDFYNPLFNTEYEVAISKDETIVQTTFTENIKVSGPRSLFIDGVENFRDIGGWGHIKQGMLYRSGRFNEDKADPVNVTISESGVSEINNHLKIKTEIDLRRTSNNEVGSLTDKSPLGDNVHYIQIPLAYGGNNILTFKGKLNNDSYVYDNPSMIKEFFDVLADEKNYPINYHCSIGKDRTGCMSYLIEGLLGFEKETMYRDYMFTNFADAGMCKLTDITDRYGQTIDEYTNGETLQEKIYNYLNNKIGVSKDNLDKIINILKA